ncbi:iron chelate uptake ABC transporter family permease subunit [Otariodibacter sp.]|uniref:ABC transporter permease n=1 Tax=Otariodibacter sp. TaxID=3030919 RepID=UPI002632D096|nr:iron chelate uptake ABC transporter family permease subunit [Otariodibacter sp.]
MNNISTYNLKWLSLNTLSLILLCILIVLSISIGVADWSWGELFSFQGGRSSQLLFVSRLPRTFAILLAGATLSIAGMILQILLRNRFVEPSMTGATQSATLGLLIMILLFPTASLLTKMSIATVSALFGMGIFVLLLQRLPKTQLLLVPVVGIIYGGIIQSISTFLAYRSDTMQMLSVWTSGDFSGVLIGRYELLWVTSILAVIAYIMADRLTIAGLGKNIATNLGLNHNRIIWIGLTIVSMITAVVVVTIGSIPFIGLVVPNIVSRLSGDQLRKNLPSVALIGACLVLVCDILGRIIIFPYEIPVSTVFGVLGTIIFLYLLYYQPRRPQLTSASNEKLR